MPAACHSITGDDVMSRAFVKELDGVETEALPELVVSPHRNFVTSEGLALIEQRLSELNRELVAVKAGGDPAAISRVERDLRYWSNRRASAEVVEAPQNPATVRFGCRVELREESGRTSGFRIVGEDESNPSRGLISYVSPLARFLLGKSVGDIVEFKGGEAEIVSIG
jgi:transcription elongation GreA/GreB family factor